MEYRMVRVAQEERLSTINQVLARGAERCAYGDSFSRR
jgi:hypothetical protein